MEYISETQSCNGLSRRKFTTIPLKLICPGERILILNFPVWLISLEPEDGSDDPGDDLRLDVIFTTSLSERDIHVRLAEAKVSLGGEEAWFTRHLIVEYSVCISINSIWERFIIIYQGQCAKKSLLKYRIAKCSHKMLKKIGSMKIAIFLTTGKPMDV